MKQTINRAVQKWSVSMTLSFAAVLVLIILGAVLVSLLPAGYIGTILIVLAVLGLMFSILIGRVIRWLVEE
ncbi:MAG: hypothetical protein SGJ03_07965 [Alphaproteobacteria bacterium]|nr:hypothetical protein [Alphaproteobacteria bacterium]